MTSKQERLKEVYNHLRSYFGIHTQIDFAESIRITRPALSSAMNGNEAYLTKNLFQKICAAYPGVFNLDYLLTGEGQLLTIEEEVTNEKLEKMVNPTPAPQAIDYTFLIEKAVEKATAYADKTITILEKQIADKDKQLDDKDFIIKLLQEKIAAYESAQQIIDSNPLRDYPFPVGVADNGEITSSEYVNART